MLIRPVQTGHGTLTCNGNGRIANQPGQQVDHELALQQRTAIRGQNRTFLILRDGKVPLLPTAFLSRHKHIVPKQSLQRIEIHTGLLQIRHVRVIHLYVFPSHPVDHHHVLGRKFQTSYFHKAHGHKRKLDHLIPFQVTASAHRQRFPAQIQVKVHFRSDSPLLQTGQRHLVYPLHGTTIIMRLRLRYVFSGTASRQTQYKNGNQDTPYEIHSLHSSIYFFIWIFFFKSRETSPPFSCAIFQYFKAPSMSPHCA